MRKKNLIIAIICFVVAVIYAAAMIILYDRLAVFYGRPNHFMVNGTALAGFFGTVALTVTGIVNMIKAFKK